MQFVQADGRVGSVARGDTRTWRSVPGLGTKRRLMKRMAKMEHHGPDDAQPADDVDVDVADVAGAPEEVAVERPKTPKCSTNATRAW